MEDDEGKECDTSIGNKSLQGRLNSGEEEEEGEDEGEEGGRLEEEEENAQRPKK